MSAPPPSLAAPAGRGLSLAGGALALRGVRAFLARGKAAAARREGGAAAVGGGGGGKARRQKPPMAPPGKLSARTLEALRRSTHFSKSELEALHAMFKRLVSAATPPATASQHTTTAATPEGIDQSTFRDVMHNTLALVTEETLLERVWTAWDRGGISTGGTTGTGSAGGGGGGGGGEGALRFEAWARGLSVLLRGSTGERLKHCFTVYDLNNDGYITRDEMFLLLKNSLLKQPGDEDPDEGVRELVELVLRKLDSDKDGRVSLEDYKQAVEQEPLLLEAFGQCLPSRRHSAAFLRTLQAR